MVFVNKSVPNRDALFFLHGETYEKKILSTIRTCYCYYSVYRRRILRWNNPASVVCYSNGIKTLDDVSTGSVKFSENGAGFYYRSKVTHKFVQVVRSECTIKEL